MKQNRRKWILLYFILITVFLAGCSQQADLYFSRSQSWRIESKLSYNDNLFKHLGDVSADSHFSLGGLDQSAVEVFMSLFQSYCTQAGVKLEWKLSNSVSGDKTIQITLKGQTLEQLNRLGHGLFTVVEEEPNRFHLTVESFNIGDSDLQLPISMGVPNTEIRVHTGGIITSNAHEVRGNTAIWFNPVRMEAVFIPSRGFNLPVIVLGVLGAVVVAAVVKGLIMNRKKTCFFCEGKIPERACVCPYCGTPLTYRSE